MEESTSNEFAELDPIFRVPSYSWRGSGRASSEADSPEYRRGSELHERARALRAASFKWAAKLDAGRETGTSLSQPEVSRRSKELAKLIISKQPEDAPLLEEWRKQVPLISKAEFEETIRSGRNGLHYYDKGTEAMVFIDDSREFVYKITPIKEKVLDVPVIDGNKPLYAKPQAFPLCDQFGEITLFQRNEIFNSLPGVARTEILAIAETGHVITKQRFVGEEQPTMAELQGWAEKHGYVCLPPQPDDPIKVSGTDLPETEGASSAMPVVFVKDGRCYLSVDIVPRNARKLPDGEIVVFDMTTRPVLKSEIQAHPEIRLALNTFISQIPDAAERKKLETEFAAPNPRHITKLEEPSANLEPGKTSRKRGGK